MTEVITVRGVQVAISVVRAERGWTWVYEIHERTKLSRRFFPTSDIAFAEAARAAVFDVASNERRRDQPNVTLGKS